MSMPISFLPAVAPVSPAGAGATGASGASGGDGGAQFGAVLDGLAAGSRDTRDGDEDTGTDPDEAAATAAGSAPPLMAAPAGLALPIGDAGTAATTAAGPTPAQVPTVLATPTRGTAPVPPSMVDNALPVGAQPAQPAGAAQQTQPAQLEQPTPQTPPALPAVAGQPTAQAQPVGPGAPAAPAQPAPAIQPAPATPLGPAAPLGPATGPATAGVPALLVPPAPPSTVDTLATPSTVDAAATTVAAAAPAGRPAAGDTDAEAGSGRQQESAALTAALAAPRADAGILAPTAPAAQATQTPQAPALPPAAQLALKLAPLRVGPDGTHQLTIHLNPEELGPISVVAQVRGDELSVQLTGSTDAGREALQAALPDLERELRDGGFNTIAVNMRETPRLDAAQRPAWAGAPGQPGGTAGLATDNATSGTGTTTLDAKTKSQPIGQVDQPDGVGNRHLARPDNLGTGMYNAAGQAVPGTGTGQPAGQHHPGQHQPGNQLNLGQPGGNQPDHGGQYGTTDQQHTGGQHGTGREGGTDRLPGRPESGERDQRGADHRPTTDRAVTRSVDLRV